MGASNRYTDGDLTLVQSTVNWHWYISDPEGHWLMHCQCDHKLTKDEMKKEIRRYREMKEWTKDVKD